MGTAFGLADCVENLGIFVMTIVWGDLADRHSEDENEYYYSLIFIMFMIFIALIISLILNYVDFNTNKILNQP